MAGYLVAEKVLEAAQVGGKALGEPVAELAGDRGVVGTRAPGRQQPGQAGALIGSPPRMEPGLAPGQPGEIVQARDGFVDRAVVAILLVEVSGGRVDPEVAEHRAQGLTGPVAEHLARDYEYLAAVEVVEKCRELEPVQARPEVPVVEEGRFRAASLPSAIWARACSAWRARACSRASILSSSTLPGSCPVTGAPFSFAVMCRARPGRRCRSTAGPSHRSSRPVHARLGTGGTMLIVANQAPVQGQDAVGLLHHPPLGLGDEPLVRRVALDGLHLDAERGAMGGDRVLEPLVDERRADRAGLRGDRSSRSIPAMFSCAEAASATTAMTRPSTSTARPRLRPGIRLPASLPVVDAGTPAAACTLCVSSTTRLGSANRPRFSRACQRSRSWIRLAGAIVAPPGEVAGHRTAGRQVVRQVIPLAAGPALVEDRVDDLPHRIAALMAADRGVRGLPRRDHWLGQGPPLVG